jgi:hypothetical protein
MEAVSACIPIAKLGERAIADERQLAELRRIINELGEQQHNNALRALDDARISREPRRELANAVNHLQDALSLSRQAYLKIDHSRWQKLTRAFRSDQTVFEEPDDNHPRYEAGKKICNADVIISTIYTALGERKLALKYAAELRNDADKAYPSVFHIEAWSVSPPLNAPPLDPDRDLGYWFSARSSQSLEEAFSFFESVSVFLMQVGANQFTAPQLEVQVRRFKEYISVDIDDHVPTYHKWEFMVSGGKDLIVQYRKALPRG